VLLLITVSAVACDDLPDYFKHDQIEEADPGPSMQTVYKPGTPGGDWTDEEVASTRQRILMMIHPNWNVKNDLYTLQDRISKTKGQISENVLLRLQFHDCIPYADGTGGCDGCLNWKGVRAETPKGHLKPDQSYKWNIDPYTTTDNNGLDQVAEYLELIYKTIDWPFKSPTAAGGVSLYQAGKSRADLWQLAGLVALERTIERANVACDQDYTARQQIRLLESREKCLIKLTKPLKFLTGRADCINTDGDYKAAKEEVQPRLYGDSRHIMDYGRDKFSMDPEHWIALQAIHGVVHQARLGVPYTWFGAGYLGNMYFKWIAETPRYYNDDGGDLSFGGNKVYPAASGGPNGEPVKMNGWRASCMNAWNTTEGGACFMRPTNRVAADFADRGNIAIPKCVTKKEENGPVYGKCEINNKQRGCEKATCEDYIVKNADLERTGPNITTPWYPGAPDRQQGWNNQFALPYEIGLYWNLTVGGAAQHGSGCPGLTDFGTIEKPNWPFRNNNHAIFNSPEMKCSANTYVPEGGDGRPMHQIVEEFAHDNDLFIEKFMEGWQKMTSNGYGELNEGPQSGWLGHYSLSKLNRAPEGHFGNWIEDNAPVKFTDETADPYICGHLGHAGTSCGYRFSAFWEEFAEKGEVRGKGDKNLNYE